MKYEDIKTPKELLQYMDEHIKYGFVDDDLKKYGSWNIEEFQETSKTKWHLSSPSRLMSVGYGHCFDQVELERDWFLKHGYKAKTYFIWFELPYENTYSCHTYLIFERNNKFYYFEHSDFNNRGIYKFNSYEEAINYQRERHIEANKKRNPVGREELEHLCIYEYNKPKYGCTLDEFIDHILSS